MKIEWPRENKRAEWKYKREGSLGEGKQWRVGSVMKGRSNKRGSSRLHLGAIYTPIFILPWKYFWQKSEKKISAIYLPFHIYPPIFILPWNNFRQNIYPPMILFLARVLISKTNISNICYIIEGRGVFQCQCQWSLFKYSKSRKFEPYFHTNHGKKLTNATEERKVYRD